MTNVLCVRCGAESCVEGMTKGAAELTCGSPPCQAGGKGARYTTLPQLARPPAGGVTQHFRTTFEELVRSERRLVTKRGAPRYPVTQIDERPARRGGFAHQRDDVRRPRRQARVGGIIVKEDRRQGLGGYVEQAHRHQSPFPLVVVKGCLASARVRKRELERITLSILGTLLPSPAILTARVPFRIERKPCVIDEGRPDHAPQPGARALGPALALGRFEPIRSDAKAHTLGASRARGTKIDGPETPPTPLEQVVELGRSHVQDDLDVEARRPPRQVRTRARRFHELLEHSHGFASA